MSRDVIFRLKIENDPNNSKVWDEFAKKTSENNDRFRDPLRERIKKEREERVKGEDETLTYIQKLKSKSAQLEYRENLKVRQEARKAQEKERAEDIRLAQARDKVIAQNYLREHLKAIDEAKKAQDRANKQREQDAIRLARIETTARNQAFTSRMAASQGFAQAGRGAIGLGRGVALAGVMGEEDSEKLLQNIIAIEAGFQTLNSGLDIWRGLAQGVHNYRKALEAARTAQAAVSAAQAAGSAAQAGGSAASGLGGVGAAGGMAGSAPLAAAIAALVAWLPAMVSASRALSIYRNGSEITRKGDAVGAAGEGISETYKDIARYLPSERTMNMAGGGIANALFAPYRESNEREDATEQIRKANEERKKQSDEFGKRITDSILSLRDVNFARNERQFALAPGMSDSERQLALSKANLRDSLNASSELGARAEQLSGTERQFGGESLKAVTEAARQAQQNVLDQIREQISLHKQVSQERVAGAQRELDLAKQSAQTARQMAEEAKNRLKSDEVRFGELSAAEQARLRDIKKKQDQGVALNTEDAQFARQFNAFKDFADESSRTRARDAGFSDIFGQQVGEGLLADAAAEMMEEQVQKAEVKLQKEYKISIEIEEGRDSLTQQLMEQFEEIAAKLEEVDAREQANKEELATKMKQVIDRAKRAKV
jgi:hypothetical protein